MKTLLIACLLLVTTAVKSQTYRYYFIDFRATGKGEVALLPENNVVYPDIDSLLCEREMNRGKELVKEKKYSSYSDVFNRLSREGLEFIEFANIPKVGGATQLLAGQMPNIYMIWRRKMN